MQVSGSGSPASSPLGPLAAGLSTQIDARNIRGALETGGLQTPELGRALDSLEIGGQKVAATAVLKMANDQAGQILDLLA